MTTGSPPNDNTAINERDHDQSLATKTLINQDENATDVAITADIRKEVMAQPNFSVNAQNVKIITSKGKVTLRGLVLPLCRVTLTGVMARICE